jgi:hypothetical protein
VTTRGLAALGATVMVVAAAPNGPAHAAAPPRVALTADATSPQGGDSITVSARVRNFPHGAVLVLKVTDPDGADTVAICRAAVCAGDWTEPDQESASFQAFVRTRLHAGRIVGRSAVLTVQWQPAPPPPPPPPAALAGHYCGLSNEGKSVCFDVGADSVTGMRLESRVRCGDEDGGWWWITPSADMPISSPGLAFSYTYTGPLTSTSGATGIQVTFTIGGTFDTAGNVSGTIHLVHISWDQNGKHYDCAGDPRTWTARLGA